MKPKRVLGEKLPLSIATAIPFEEVIVTDIGTNATLVISVRTLFRNYLGAFSKDDMYTLEQVVEEFSDELALIESYCKMQRIVFVPYDCRYKNYAKLYPKWEQPPGWESKVNFSGLYDAVMSKIDFQYTKLDINHSLPQRTGIKEYILTAFPVDLLTLGFNRRTKLLESHTGAVKAPYEWISKLTSNKNYHSWPFNHFTFQLLGDKSLTHKGASVKLKNRVMEVADKNKWMPHININKCRDDIKKSKMDSAIKEEILEYFK